MSASSRLPHPVCSGFSFCLLYSVLSLLPCLSLSVSFNLSCLQVDIVCLVLSCLSRSVSSSLSVLSCLALSIKSSLPHSIYLVLSLLYNPSRSVCVVMSVRTSKCLSVHRVCLAVVITSRSVLSSLSRAVVSLVLSVLPPVLSCLS